MKELGTLCYSFVKLVVALTIVVIFVHIVVDLVPYVWHLFSF